MIEAAPTAAIEPVRRSYVAADGVTIAYEDWGASSAPAVLLCHGLAAAGRQLQADAAFFAAAGYRVLLPDLRGHGRSGRPRSSDAHGYTIETLGRDLLGVLDQSAVDRVHWVGNSLGGIVALPLLSSHAGRFLSFASFGTAYALSLPSWVPGAIPLVHRALGRRLRGSLTARMTTRNPAARPLIAELVANSDPDAAWRLAHHAHRYDFTAEVQASTVPILLLRCELDVAVNRALAPAIDRMRGRPGFTIVDLAGAGHCANLDATEAWRAALLAFWRRVCPAS